MIPGLLASFFSLLSAEPRARKSAGLDDIPLRTYLRQMFTSSGELYPLGAFGYSERLALMLDALAAAPARARLLDAGCGYGTESLLFALSGREVWGVELVSERAEFARSRVDYYQKAAGRPLDIRFINAHIFRFLETAPSFDIIWAMEANGSDKRQKKSICKRFISICNLFAR